MNRKKLVEKAFQRGPLLTMRNPFYAKNLLSYFNYKYINDIGKKGDITTNAILKSNRNVKAVIKAKEKGIISGLEEITFIYKKYKVQVKSFTKDGKAIKKNQKIVELYGKEKTLMMLERICMDLLQRMSGISTMTASLIKKIGKNTIAPTRKTELLYLDKKAVYDAKGFTHRLALWDAILIKENHLEMIKKEKYRNYIEEAINRAVKNKKQAKFIEIEVKNKKEALQAAVAIDNIEVTDGATIKFKRTSVKKEVPCIIMLDNFTPKKIKETIKELKREKLLQNILIEASGGITPKNIKQYAKTGVDMLSLGYLTHSAKALDFTQLIL